jgi:hypothetical protein
MHQNGRQRRWNWFGSVDQAMNDIAREIGEMYPNDPLRSERINEFHALTKLSKATKAERNNSFMKRWTYSHASWTR